MTSARATVTDGGRPSREPVTGEAVRDAALTLFAQRGYHGTALRNIADEVRIRTPSLYNHIDSKQELLRAVLQDTSERVWSEFADSVKGIDDVVERLWRAVHVYALRHATHPREAIIVNRDVASLDEPARSAIMQLRRRHERAVRQVIEDGVRKKAFIVRTPFLASFGILEMCVGIARWFDPSGPLTADQIASQYADFALQMVQARRPARPRTRR